MTTARVDLWGRRIGAVSYHAERRLGFFEFDPEFVRSHIELAPLKMPLAPGIYSFPELDAATFLGLPGMLADALPDKFGNALIDAWLAHRGRTPEGFDPVERLCYVGARGMGALEFAPALGPIATESRRLHVEDLVDLASAVLTDRKEFVTRIGHETDNAAIRAILHVGTSAGGARAKAVIAWNRETGEIRSGQVESGRGFSDWLLKFDGVSGNRDRELEDPKGFGRIEYAYHEMAKAAGIEMTECHLLEENGRAHFMTRRFDRDHAGRKIHLQSLCALAHLDFNLAGAHSYEQAVLVIRQLGLPMRAIEEQFRRMAFNVIARNQDDHTKNIAFLMDRTGAWSLSPAFDVTFAHNPDGAWTSQHQMSVNGKRDHFDRQDFIDFGKTAAMKRGRAATILDEVLEAVRHWPEFAAGANVPAPTAAAIGRTHRTGTLASSDHA